MLNRQAICFGTFCVLFIASAVFAQTDTITEKIYQSEEKIREHVDKKVEGIETKISAVDTKVDNLNTKVGTLSTDVAVNKTNIVNMKEDIRDLKGTVDRIWYVTLVTLISIVGFFLRSWWQNRGKADNVDAVDRLAKQISDLTTAQAETSAQITNLLSAQAEISTTRNIFGDPKVPSEEELDEFTDNIRTQQHGTTDTV